MPFTASGTGGGPSAPLPARPLRLRGFLVVPWKGSYVVRSVRLAKSLACATPLLVSCGSSSGSKSGEASGGTGAVARLAKEVRVAEVRQVAAQPAVPLDAAAEGTESARPTDGAVVVDRSPVSGAAFRMALPTRSRTAAAARPGSAAKQDGLRDSRRDLCPYRTDHRNLHRI
jgi:hypothetical protein